MKQEEIERILKAGEIEKKVKEYVKSFIKKDILLLEIAEKIENKILELGGKPAFPTNLSINEIAAHYTPSYNDETKAHGLLKVDLGVQVEGFIADSAFSLDLENSEENKRLIKASEEALNNAIKSIIENKNLGEIGEIIQETINSFGFSPITNLTGHEIKEYELHSGLTIFNIKNNNKEKLNNGLYAIEPFVTKGIGKIYEGKPSEIYVLQDDKNIRSNEAREILNYIIKEYKTLPFCSRWIVKKFGVKSLFYLKQLEKNGNLYNYPELIEESHQKVSQSENTILIYEKENKRDVFITTE
jgi:methionyl aminopeptidase